MAATSVARSAVDTIAARAAKDAHKQGVDPREVAATLYVGPRAPVEPVDAAAQRRRQLRDQIAALDRTLADLQVAHPGILPPPEAKRRAGAAGPRLLGVGALEQEQSRLVRQLAALQAAIDERARAPRSERRRPRTSAAPSPRARRPARGGPAPASA